MATHSSTLAWRNPWTEKPGGSSPQGRKESDTTEATKQQQLIYSLSIISSRSFLLLLLLSHFSCVRLFAIPWTVAHQAPLFMEFPRQEYWSGWPCPSPGDLPNPRIKPGSPALQADSLPSEPSGKPHYQLLCHKSSKVIFGKSSKVILLPFSSYL